MMIRNATQHAQEMPTTTAARGTNSPTTPSPPTP